MGRQAVRLAIAAALSSGQQANLLPYLGTIYPARPYVMNEQDYFQTMTGQAIQTSASGSSAVLVVSLPSNKRERRTLTGRGAYDDTNIHDVVLELFFASQPSSGLAQDAGIDAQEDYDLIVDSLFQFIRTNQSMNSTVVWSAGEFAYGVEHEQSQPYQSADGTTVLITGVVRFQAWEWLTNAI